MLKNTTQQFGSLTKSLHWLMAALFLIMYAVAYVMINLSKSDFRLSLYNLHKATGLLLFLLVALRLSWRLVNVQPKLLISGWQHIAAKTNIFLLYGLMIFMPLTGIFTSLLSGHTISFYGLFVIPEITNDQALAGVFSEAHYILSIVLIIAFTLHVLGALQHHFILRDGVLRRMWFGQAKNHF